MIFECVVSKTFWTRLTVEADDKADAIDNAYMKASEQSVHDWCEGDIEVEDVYQIG